MKDLSLKTLKVYYECQNNGTMNSDFESDIRDLAKKYGITFYASGMDMVTGVRDLAFDLRDENRKCHVCKVAVGEKHKDFCSVGYSLFY